jgi:hypothetical protein
VTLTVACVLKSGGSYGPEDVMKLWRGVKNHTRRSFEFMCLTDVVGVMGAVDMHLEWPGWWSKLCLFEEGTLAGYKPRVPKDPAYLYLDLDTIILGSLDEFVERASSKLQAQRADIVMLQDRRYEVLKGSGIMYWERPELLTHLYDRFAADPAHYMQQYSCMPWLGDQAFIQHHLNPNSIATFAPGTTACLNLDTEEHCKAALVAYNSWQPKLPEMAKETGWRGELVRSAWT